MTLTTHAHLVLRSIMTRDCMAVVGQLDIMWKEVFIILRFVTHLKNKPVLIQVAGDERPFTGPRPCGHGTSLVQATAAGAGASPSNSCSVHHKSLPDLHTSPSRTPGPSSSGSSDFRYCRFVLGAQQIDSLL
jgi:hypothetical protein